MLKNLLNKYSIYFILLAFVVVLAVASGGTFLQLSNLESVIRQSSIIGIIAFGVTLVIITAGIDLSSGAVLALISVIVASLAQQDTGTGIFIKFPGLPDLPIIVPVLVGLLVGSCIGFINGGLITWTKIPPFIPTLGMFTAARGAAFLYANGRPLSSLSEKFNQIGQGSVWIISNPVLLFFICGVITYVILRRTKLGRYIYAVGANKNAAYVSGIRTNRVLIFVYMFAGLMTGVSAIILTSRIGSGQAGLGTSYELYAIASAVIGGTSFTGGRGTVGGTVVGALLIGVIRNGMDILNVSVYWQQIILGFIIVIAIVIDQRKQQVLVKAKHE